MQIFFLVTELRDRGVGLRRGVSQPWAGELEEKRKESQSSKMAKLRWWFPAGVQLQREKTGHSAGQGGFPGLTPSGVQALLPALSCRTDSLNMLKGMEHATSLA